MMPTFPRSSLSFRTAGFPQYGWEVGFPSGAFLDRRQLKPAPGMRCLSSSLHPPFVHLGVTRLSRTVSGHGLDSAPPWRGITPPPQGSSLGFGRGRDASYPAHRVAGGGRPPPAPTERSVRICRTTLFNSWFTALAAICSSFVSMVG